MHDAAHPATVQYPDNAPSVTCATLTDPRRHYHTITRKPLQWHFLHGPADGPKGLAEQARQAPRPARDSSVGAGCRPDGSGTSADPPGPRRATRVTPPADPAHVRTRIPLRRRTGPPTADRSALPRAGRLSGPCRRP